MPTLLDLERRIGGGACFRG